MKLIKAMKKLKFWSPKKNNKKKSNNYYYHNPNLYYQPPYYPLPPPLPPPPPPPIEEVCHCHFCHPSSSLEPSAPPLPAWLDESPNWAEPLLGPTHASGDQSVSVISQEIVVVKTSSSQLEQPSSSPLPSSSSYQQLHSGPDQNQDYGLQRREKSTSRWVFGCGFGVGSFLIRCFFPCFHISEARVK